MTTIRPVPGFPLRSTAGPAAGAGSAERVRRRAPSRLVAALALPLVIGCANDPAEVDTDPADAMLVGPIWTLVRFQSTDGQDFDPATGGSFTLRFVAEGLLDVQADCERGHGSWHSDGGNTLQIDALALGGMRCGAQSLHDSFLGELARVRSFALREGDLSLTTMGEGATLEFRSSAQSRP